MRMVGVMDTFGESGDAPSLMKKYGLTADEIEAAALALRTARS
jgi:transketolase C-terminal domain/subunit